MKKLASIILVISSLLVIAACSSTNKNTQTKGRLADAPQNKKVSIKTGKPKLSQEKVNKAEQTHTKVDKTTKKYASQMSADASKLNPELYNFIDEWIGVKYKMGGVSKKGVDCSGFVGLVYKHFGKTIPRTTRDLSKAVNVKGLKKLEEGDLVFFSYARTNSHVGIYLQNGWFVHASTARGVTLSDLNEAHYKKRFNMGGTPKTGGL